MENIQIFTSEIFGEIRTCQVNNQIMFVAKDVATALGYTNTPKAIRDHIDDDDKLTERFVLSGQVRSVIIINESGLYALILSSKLPQAKAFKHWVTAEVQLKQKPGLWRELLLKAQTPTMLEAYDVIADSLLENALYFFRDRIENAFQSRDYAGGLNGERQKRGKNDSILNDWISSSPSSKLCSTR